MCNPNPEDTCQNPAETQACETPEEDLSCVCASMCDKLKQKIKEIDTKEVFDTTMENVRKRPLLGVLVAATIGYFLGRLSKKFS